MEKVKNQDLIFTTLKGKGIKAFEELCRPENKRDCQVFSGMLSSLQRWNPTIALEIPLIRKASVSKGRFIWTDDMLNEYEVVRETMLEQIQLTPFDLNKSLRLVIDAASTEGAGFVLFQFVDKMDPGSWAVIANCTRFKESQL